MKYRKFTKYEKQAMNKTKLANAQLGSGIYMFQNRNTGTFTLPRPTKSGIRQVGGRAKFEGDSYYLSLVPTDLILVEVIKTPEQEKLEMEQKLILDQPEKVTVHGKVEHVVMQPEVKKIPLDEANNAPKPDVLLNETPGDDGFVFLT